MSDTREEIFKITQALTREEADRRDYYGCKCPWCGGLFWTYTKAAYHNVTSYIESARVRANCCGNLVVVTPEVRIKLSQFTGTATEDNWGN